MKPFRAVVLATVVAVTTLVVAASPAMAAGGTVAASKPWHYWMAVGLFLGLIPVAALMGLGYYYKVWRPKHRGRKVS